VPVKQLIKDLQPLFESKDVKARDRVKEIVVGSMLPAGQEAILMWVVGYNLRTVSDSAKALSGCWSVVASWTGSYTQKHSPQAGWHTTAAAGFHPGPGNHDLGYGARQPCHAD
jgi:hypothetical protein